MNQLPVPQQSNNGILNTTNAMSNKELTSDNESTFAMNRNIFQKSYQPPINFMQFQMSYSRIQRQSPAIQHGYILDGPKSVGQKKWIGGNRDASNIINKRRTNTTGAIDNTTGPKSFKNPNDNNPRIEALARVRGSGYRVPPKVSNRPVNISIVPIYYRIISAGLKAVTAGVINISSSTAYGAIPGIYTYDYQTNIETPLANLQTSPPKNYTRSYNVLTIDRKTGGTTFTTYDIFNDITSSNPIANAMINQLNSLDSSVIVVVSTYDEPENNGTHFLLQTFVDAMKRCGASAYFGSDGEIYNPGSYEGFIHFRGSYVLVGIPGVGVGGGLERYIGDNISGGDPNACVDLRFSVTNEVNGQYTYISG